MKIDKRNQGPHQISFASRFVVFWCVGMVIGIVGAVVYFY